MLWNDSTSKTLGESSPILGVILVGTFWPRTTRLSKQDFVAPICVLFGFVPSSYFPPIQVVDLKRDILTSLAIYVLSQLFLSRTRGSLLSHGSIGLGFLIASLSCNLASFRASDYLSSSSSSSSPSSSPSFLPSSQKLNAIVRPFPSVPLFPTH